MEIKTGPKFDINDFKHDPLLLTEEGIHRYCPGGFHPVSLGDTFQNGLYTVHHKLGFGESATVWLAKKKTVGQNVISCQWVALKILAAYIERPRETENLNHLKNSTIMLSTKHIVELLDTFQLQGPNGIHHCLVFELLGPSLESTQQAYIEFNNYGHYIEFDNTDFKELTNYLGIECPRVLRIVTALFVALKFMHTWGICHGGISAANIAYTYGGRQHHVTDDKIFEAMGLPQVVPLERCDRMPLSEGLPKELVQSAQWNGYLEEAEFDIRLIGFGKSSLYGQESDKVKQAVHLRCPETIMGGKHLYHTDLWHAGCFVTPPDEHDHQLQDLSDISQGPQQVLPEVAAVTPGSLISHESQQPQASEPFQSAKTTQSEASEIPDNSKEPQLDLTEDTAASSDDSETKPGSRKRLRSRLGGLLNHKWRPWKRRRDS